MVPVMTTLDHIDLPGNRARQSLGQRLAASPEPKARPLPVP